MNETKLFDQLGSPMASESGPVTESSRLLALDTTRAIALLGIFFVNASLFGEPFVDLFRLRAPVDQGFASLAIFWFTSVFCTGKFYPLFSLLFGVGLAIMYEAAVKRHGRFGWMYFRRLIGLGTFGILHIVFLWWGDVLLIYALVGLWMLLLGRRSPRTLLIVGAIVFVVGQLLAVGFISMQLLQVEDLKRQAAPDKPMPVAASRSEQVLAVIKDWNTEQPYDSRFKTLEREAFTEGPFAAAAAVRSFHYLFCVPFFLTMFMWVVLPCFCLGAALLKLGFFHGRLTSWRARLIKLGLFVGLPLSIFSGVAALYHENSFCVFAAPLAINVGGPLMSLMYLSLVLNWVDSGRAAGLARSLAYLGQMGLTGYLLESFLMSAVMMFWGLGRFGQTTWAERGFWVLAIYIAILAFANLWMRVFRFGPLEWLWRTFTYLRIQPLLRLK